MACLLSFIASKPRAVCYTKFVGLATTIRPKSHTQAQLRLLSINGPCLQRIVRLNCSPVSRSASTRPTYASLSTASAAATPHSKASYSKDDNVPLVYEPPRTGVVASLPKSWIPYAELIRLDKPTGTYYLFFPCLFSTLIAATYHGATLLEVLSTTILFFTGALVMRGAGCTINDLWDRNLDPHVARTRLRPIARGAVAPSLAVVFTGFQLLTGLAILLQFPTSCLYYGIPSLVLVATYPLAKRITHYPQFVLGLTFSWGALMGFPALGVDLMADSTAVKAAGLLYSSCVSWTVLYDMIYAHMDIKDDAKAGIKSIALRHNNETKTVLSGLAVVQIGLLAASGMAIGAGPVFFVGSCGSAAVTLGTMIWKVKLKDVNNCWWWFKNGALLTGGGIAAGLLGEYVLQKDGTHYKAVKQELL
ncbi:Para-hydroxybenzoate--polyprenyltransferase, mitochondrial precursor (PHB:polyprenyltransferase) [Xylographa vitiligo]|nr:Para-hydroxybenzoate--polyprenyltransferase, mitochondrial precursor (PHB:polyprenyltransferase) [Xylographa vitiligo]